MSNKDVIEKAYGNIPKEVNYGFHVDIIPFRGVKYYWLRLIRFFTR